jgi:Zn-dependent peptidase ImmA (M78 family)
VALDAMIDLLQSEFNYELQNSVLANNEALAGYRSVFVNGRQPKLFINNRLRPRQIKFLLAREIGYQHLGLQERSYTSTPDRVDSFQQVLNDFKASYFAGALLMPRTFVHIDIQSLFSQEQWRPQFLRDMLTRYHVTPEMLLYRFSELVPEYFGLKLHFLRVHRANGRYRMVKRLNMNRLPMPSGLALHEHYCRRLLTSRLLQEMNKGVEPRDQPLVGVQMSEFLESGERFLCLGFARSLVLAPTVDSSVEVGFRAEPNLDEVVRFLHDPAVPFTVVNETCERCPLTDEQCDVRAAESVVLLEEQVKVERQKAVNDLLARYQDSSSET